jgi:hypothetical protein
MSVTARPAGRAAAPPLLFSQVATDYSAAVGTINYDGGTRNVNYLPLIPDGYVRRLGVNVSLAGQYGTAGPTAVDPLASWAGPIERIEIVGTQNRGLYNLRGEFAGMMTFLDRWYRNSGVPASALVSGPGFNAVALPGVAAWADTWQIDVPFEVKIEEFDAPIGLYPVGFTGPAPRINVYFRPVNAAVGAQPGSGVYTPAGTSTGPAPTGLADIQQFGFAPVTNPNARKPPSNLTPSYREGALTINGNQTYTIEMQQGAFCTRMILLIIANGTLAPYTAISNMEYDYGFGMRRKQWTNAAQINSMMLTNWGGAGLPNYMIVIDLLTETHSMRDWINTTAVVRPKLQITLQGLTFGGVENEIRYAVMEVFPTAVAIAQSVR